MVYKRYRTNKNKKIKKWKKKKERRRAHQEGEPSPTSTQRSVVLHSHSDESFLPASLRSFVPLLTHSAWPLVFFTVCGSRVPFKTKNFGPQPWSSKQQYWILVTNRTKPRVAVAPAATSLAPHSKVLRLQWNWCVELQKRKGIRKSLEETVCVCLRRISL